MFETQQDLMTALQAADDICFKNGYEIIEMDNRLSKKETKDVVLKVRVKKAVCQFQLAMRQDESKYHFIHSVYEIERSPLGCIFGSYLFMSKGVKYPFIVNCRDIRRELSKSNKQEDKKTCEAAEYIVTEL